MRTTPLDVTVAGGVAPAGGDPPGDALPWLAVLREAGPNSMMVVTR